ncbi:MAG: hypothetical protein LBQ54_11570 [Planctomycetaceae bacterium]|jgi:general secretion pathway protein D|nr:hypothetical protein [Planctomycetaceae bacterium]
MKYISAIISGILFHLAGNAGVTAQNMPFPVPPAPQRITQPPVLQSDRQTPAFTPSYTVPGTSNPAEILRNGMERDSQNLLPPNPQQIQSEPRRTVESPVIEKPQRNAVSVHNSSLPEAEIGVINIKEMTLLELARLFGQCVCWKIIVSREAGVIPINTYFEEISGEDTIRAVCQANNLWYRKDQTNGIISIMTVEEYRRGLLSHSQDTVKVVTLLYPDARAVGDAVQRLFKNRVVWTPPDEYLNDPIEDVERALERMDSMTDRVQTIQMSQYGSGNRSYSSSSGRSRSGTSSSRYGNRSRQQQQLDPLADNRIVEDIEQTVAPEALVAQLSGAAPAPSENQLGEPGIIYVSAFRGSNDLMLRSSDPEAIEEVLKVIGQLDKPKPQVLLEVKVLDIRLNEEESYGLDWLFKSGDASGGRSTGIAPDGYGTGFGDILKPDATLKPLGNGLDPKAMILQIVSNDVGARIQAMQDSGRVVSLATPNLCVADGEASRIFVGRETTVLTSVSVNTNTYTGTATTTETVYSPETERMNVGTTLLITPRIHADRTTTIRIVQEDSKVGDVQHINFGVTHSFESTDIETRTVATTVVASDGQISAIGGLIREEAEDRDVGVPGLMKIPYVGTVFKTSFKKRERHELLVLIRPFILLAPGEAGAVSDDMLKRLSEHPSAGGTIPPLRIGEGSFTIVNERIYDIPKDAFNAIKCQAVPWSTEEE